MSIEKVFQIIVSSISALIVGGIIGSWIQRILYRPKVLIEVSHSSPFEHEGGFYISVAVTNKGANAAQDCLGAITIHNLSSEDILSPNDKIIIENENLSNDATRLLLTPKNFREIDRELLCWAHIGNPDKFKVNPGMKTLLDVMKAIYNKKTNEWYIVIPTEEGWNTLRARLKDKNYAGEIIVSPSNGSPHVRKFKVINSYESNENKPKFLLL